MASPVVVCIGNPLVSIEITVAPNIFVSAAYLSFWNDSPKHVLELLDTPRPVLLTPQLDIQVSPQDGPKYLEKYTLKANDAILAEDKHLPM
jgi:hypothetical protein